MVLKFAERKFPTCHLTVDHFDSFFLPFPSSPSLIQGLMESNLGRLQVELYKEIKRNGGARSLRAALSRFAEMARLIRPLKCRPYIVNLLPCLQRIAMRTEESVQETLGRIYCTVLLDATTHLYKRSCSSVRLSDGPSPVIFEHRIWPFMKVKSNRLTL